MEIESKQPHSKRSVLQRGRQILERRKEIDPIKKLPLLTGQANGKWTKLTFPTPLTLVPPSAINQTKMKRIWTKHKQINPVRSKMPLASADSLANRTSNGASTPLKPKVFVAMSGGVDSSTTAALLKKIGHDVYGVFMREWVPKGMECAEPENRQMAARAAAHIGIPFAVWDFRAVYETNVASYLIREYAAGRTPNPDIMCNKDIKFGVFLDTARRAGADYISTGHYIEKRKTKNEKRKTLERLYMAKDKNKDQSYFLWTLTQEQLRYCLFPIGNYMKPEVRIMAKKFGLPNWDRKDSQGVCFVGELNFGEFLRSQLPVQEGVVVTTDGTVVGTHDGVEFYTIGQKVSIKYNVSNIKRDTKPLYVTEKDIKTHTLVVTDENDSALFKKEMVVSNVSWISGEQPKLPLKCLTRIRYRQPLQSCRIEAQNYTDSTHNNAEFFSANVRVTSASVCVRFAQPQRAVTPGQSAVFYLKTGEMLGGGIIE